MVAEFFKFIAGSRKSNKICFCYARESRQKQFENNKKIQLVIVSDWLLVFCQFQWPEQKQSICQRAFAKRKYLCSCVSLPNR